MRRLLFAAALLGLAAASASAQTPSIPGSAPIPRPVPLPRIVCTDLAIVGWNGSRSPPGAPLAENEVAIYFNVRNNGPSAYATPDENKQWISLVVDLPSGPEVIGVNVLPPSGSGPATLARGASWRGHVRATLPAGVTRSRHPPARLELSYAPASAGWTPPTDCNIANNTRSVIFR